MQCARCQHENPPESNLCLGCGPRQGLQCASGGSELQAGSRFCNNCGHAVTAGPVSEAPSSGKSGCSVEILPSDTPRSHPLRSLFEVPLAAEGGVRYENVGDAV